MTVSVVTPWWNHFELVDDYLAALRRGGFPDELLVIDDASTPRVEFAKIRLDSRSGFSHACNAGLHAATGDVVVFLNNDIADGAEGWLRKLAHTVAPGILAGPVLRSDAHADVDGQPMPYLDGWCIAGDREDLLALGGFDEDYTEPAYYSDNDLCLRARASGVTLKQVNGLRLTHKLNTSTTRPEIAAAMAANRPRYETKARQLLRVAA